MSRVKEIIIVLSQWCPHCVPLSLEKSQKMAEDLGVPLRVLDIDIEDQCKKADGLVEKHGDFVEDYLIPQVFLENEEGSITHIFTGYSEGVAVTERQWENLFASCAYWRLLTEQKGGDNSFASFVVKHLSFHGKCRRHCDKETSFTTILRKDDMIVGAYTCPSSFVSTVIYASPTADRRWFTRFLQEQLGADLVRERDIRVATRHSWELGEKAASELNHLLPISAAPALKEIYWTFYPQSVEAKTRCITLCRDPITGKGCKHLFMQDMTEKEQLCPSCREV